MHRRGFLGGTLLLPWSVNAQVPISFNGQLYSQKINAICLAGQDYSSVFLPSLGAQRINATIYSEVRGRAFFDVTNNQLNEQDLVYGLMELRLLPNRALLMAMPLEYLGFGQVRLRLLNEDRVFGRFRATLNVYS